MWGLYMSKKEQGEFWVNLLWRNAWINWKMSKQIGWGKEIAWRLNSSWNLLLVVKHVSVVWIFACCFIFTLYCYYCVSFIILWCFDIGSLYPLPSFFWRLALQLSLLVWTSKSGSLSSPQTGLWPGKHLASSETVWSGFLFAGESHYFPVGCYNAQIWIRHLVLY